MSAFSRGLSDDLTEALRRLARDPRDSWWKEVLANKDLLLAVRAGYLNAYVKGQSVFKIGPNVGGGKPRVETHFKYLIAPEMNGGNSYVSFDGDTFKVDPMKVVPTQYEHDVTLKRLVRTAARFSGAEKTGVHRIAVNEPKVVDLEIAFNSSDEADEKPTAPRMDLAVLVPGSSRECRLVFCEAKCADNAELWKLEKHSSSSAVSQIAVVSQIAKYEKFIRANEKAIVDAYGRVCQTLVELAEQRQGKTDPLIADVARGGTLTINPNVYLLIYDFDADQKKGAVQKRVNELNQILGHRVIAKGNPSSFRLSEDIRRSEISTAKEQSAPVSDKNPR